MDEPRVKTLLSEHADKYAGRPIVVLGGAPCVLDDLSKITQSVRDQAIYLGANGHAFKIPGQRVDYVVVNDDIHQVTRERMEDLLRPHGVPLISRHHWADIRQADWRPLVNSGLMAILVAVVLGGHPVIVTGIENYQGAGTYHHDLTAKSGGRNAPNVHFDRQIGELARFVAGAAIRPVSGPLTRWFPVYWPKEEFHVERDQVPRITKLQSNQVVRQCAFFDTVSLFPPASIPPGTVIPVSLRELSQVEGRGGVDVTENTDPNLQARLERATETMQRWRKMRNWCRAKLPRDTARVPDADMHTIFRLHEEGLDAESIARKAGLVAPRVARILAVALDIPPKF